MYLLNTYLLRVYSVPGDVLADQILILLSKDRCKKKVNKENHLKFDKYYTGKKSVGKEKVGEGNREGAS